MPKLNPATDLARKIQALRTEHAKLKTRLDELDSLFGQLGIKALGESRKRGRPPGSVAGAKKQRRRKRGSFSKTGEESILGFVQKHGQPNAAEVNKHWSGEGRKGKADNTLTRLVKDGKLQRVEVKGERGGRYKVA